MASDPHRRIGRLPRAARAAVADWTLFLVRGLPDAIARDRFDEIVSDLWEQQHAAEQLGTSGTSIALAVLTRAARGVPADLSWRWTAAHPSPTATWTRRSEGSIMTRKHDNPAAKPWVPLTDTTKPFDQTNGVVDFDVEDAYSEDNTDLTLMEKGAATSILSAGLGGLS